MDMTAGAKFERFNPTTGLTARYFILEVRGDRAKVRVEDGRMVGKRFQRLCQKTSVFQVSKLAELSK